MHLWIVPKFFLKQIFILYTVHEMFLYCSICSKRLWRLIIVLSHLNLSLSTFSSGQWLSETARAATLLVLHLLLTVGFTSYYDDRFNTTINNDSDVCLMLITCNSSVGSNAVDLCVYSLLKIRACQFVGGAGNLSVDVAHVASLTGTLKVASQG